LDAVGKVGVPLSSLRFSNGKTAIDFSGLPERWRCRCPLSVVPSWIGQEK